MEKELVKVQLPLLSNIGNAPMLVYNKNREHYSQQPIDEKVVKLMGEHKKMFMLAEWDGEHFHNFEIAPAQAYSW